MRWILAVSLLMGGCAEDGAGGEGEGEVAGEGEGGGPGGEEGEGEEVSEEGEASGETDGDDHSGEQGEEGEGEEGEGEEGEGEEREGEEGEGEEGEGEEGEGEEGEGEEGEGEGEVDPVCVDSDLYEDADGDGFGVEPVTDNQCVVPGEPPDGKATQAGDCRPGDPWANPDAQEICGDHVDDDCNGVDAACPESRPAAMQTSAYDCTGDPEDFVLASAHFPDGGDWFADGACFVVFEGSAGEFYVRHNLERSNPQCAETRNGCTCPSLDGRPSYDRRLYALTLRGEADACDNLEIVDHAGEEQAVSNDCRKYLYQLHFYDIPFSFFAAGEEVARRRIDLFPTVELACLRDAPHRYLPFRSLLTQAWRYNPDYAPAQ